MYTWFVARWFAHSHGAWFHDPYVVHAPAQGSLTLHLRESSILQTVRDKGPIHHWGHLVSCKQETSESIVVTLLNIDSCK